MNGKVVHFEIPAKDIKRAKAFYKDVFSWQTTDIPEMNYIMLGTTESDGNGRPTEPGAINGGMTKKQKPVEVPVITLQVDDIDSALKEVEKHGGRTVTKRTSMGENGFFGYFKDPEGNVMGLFESPARA